MLRRVCVCVCVCLIWFLFFSISTLMIACVNDSWSYSVTHPPTHTCVRKTASNLWWKPRPGPHDGGYTSQLIPSPSQGCPCPAIAATPAHSPQECSLSPLGLHVPSQLPLNYVEKPRFKRQDGGRVCHTQNSPQPLSKYLPLNSEWKVNWKALFGCINNVTISFKNCKCVFI